MDVIAENVTETERDPAPRPANTAREINEQRMLGIDHHPVRFELAPDAQRCNTIAKKEIEAVLIVNKIGIGISQRLNAALGDGGLIRALMLDDRHAAITQAPLLPVLGVPRHVDGRA